MFFINKHVSKLWIQFRIQSFILFLLIKIQNAFKFFLIIILDKFNKIEVLPFQVEVWNY